VPVPAKGPQIDPADRFAGSAGILSASFSQPIRVTRRLEAGYVFGLTAALKAWSPGFSRLGIRLAPTRHNFGRAAG